MGNYSSEQFSQGDIFGCFSDSLPDRWGRVLTERREQILAQQEHRPLRHLSSFDYLKSIDDFSRMGAFRFKEQPDGPYINSEDHLSIPPIVYIRKLVDASWHIEQSEEEEMLPEDKWIEQLYHPGTSLGGARPKSSVLDEHGRLCIAKFPSRKDRYDVALWEHLCHLLANKAGITVAETRVMSPAYDLNPSLSHEQSLMISDNSCSSSLTDLLEACEDYYITSDVAADIIQQVRDAVHSWRETAELLHIAHSEQQLFASRLDEFQ